MILMISLLYIPFNVRFIGAEEKAVEQPTTPINIVGDAALIDPDNHKVVFRGNARAVQGQTHVTADQITIILPETSGKPAVGGIQGFEDVERIEAEGNVRIVFDQYIALSEKVIYLSSERKLILSGPGTKITSDKEEIIANEMTYERDTGRMFFTGNKENQVKATVRTNERVLN
jgi:lipopolysaccharide export system protein LptA